MLFQISLNVVIAIASAGCSYRLRLQTNMDSIQHCILAQGYSTYMFMQTSARSVNIIILSMRMRHATVVPIQRHMSPNKVARYTAMIAYCDHSPPPAPICALI